MKSKGIGALGSKTGDRSYPSSEDLRQCIVGPAKNTHRKNDPCQVFFLREGKGGLIFNFSWMRSGIGVKPFHISFHKSDEVGAEGIPLLVYQLPAMQQMERVIRLRATLAQG